jgi:hypothetical protein
MSAASQSIETSRLDMAALRQMTFVELEALYRTAPPPKSIPDLDGDTLGAMLAWRKPASGPLASLLRKFGASKSFPWEGKSFRSHSDEAGEGINRVKFFGKRRWFPFKTRFGESFLDGKRTFILDYSGPANPPFIRSLVDEVREAVPGLYFGPAALKVGGKPKKVLFFALQVVR